MSHYISFEESITYHLYQLENSFAGKLALVVGSESFTYGQLYSQAKQLAEKLMLSQEERCLILSPKTSSAFIALLAALFAGKCYIFLNTKDTAKQLSEKITLAQSRFILIDVLIPL